MNMTPLTGEAQLDYSAVSETGTLEKIGINEQFGASNIVS